MTYDIIIIGAGPGGYVAAERAGAQGLKVLLIEKSELGGVCLNRGCIPTKSLLHSAKVYTHAREGERFGVQATDITFDLTTAMAWKEQNMNTLRKGITFLMKKNKVNVVHGTARITGTGVVESESHHYEGKYIILATGSSPSMLSIPGADHPHVVTSKDVLNLTALPDQIAIIGGGVIGMEFASFFTSLGRQVHVFEMLPEIMPVMDAKLAVEMRKSMKDVHFHLGTRVERIEKKKLWYATKDRQSSVDADLVLIAVGRVPNTANLGLEEMKIDVTQKGIVVNEQMQTNVPGIYAIGDVTGTSMLAHSASRMAEVAVNTILKHPDRMRYDAIPWVSYTIPEAAGCGLTEDQAQQQGYEVQVHTSSYQSNGRMLVENETGYAKLVADKKTGRVLGIHLLGAYASEHIFAASVMRETDIRAQELREIVFPHPTAAETMREAAFGLQLNASHIPKE